MPKKGIGFYGTYMPLISAFCTVLKGYLSATGFGRKLILSYRFENPLYVAGSVRYSAGEVKTLAVHLCLSIILKILNPTLDRRFDLSFALPTTKSLTILGSLLC